MPMVDGSVRFHPPEAEALRHPITLSSLWSKSYNPNQHTFGCSLFFFYFILFSRPNPVATFADPPILFLPSSRKTVTS